MASKVADLIFVYSFLKRLVTPFNETKAYQLGIIDDKGKKIRSPQTKEELDSFSTFERLVFNIKKIVEKFPGGRGKLASYAAALFLIKEHENPKEYYSDKELYEQLEKEMKNLHENDVKTFASMMNEDAPANATGSAVAGTGDTGDAWQKPDARKKKMKQYLADYLKKRGKREEQKKKKEMRKLMGLM